MKNFENARKNMLEKMNMSEKEAKMLKAMLHPEKPAPSSFMTVAEYIEKYAPKTETRTSAKGVELVKVFYPNGVVKEYEASRISDITAYEF